MRLPAIIALLTVLGPAAAAPAGEAAPAKPGPPAGVLGAWQSTEGKDVLIRFEAGRLTLRHGKQLLIARILRWKKDGGVARVYGRSTPFLCEVAGDALTYAAALGGKRGKDHKFTRLKEVPEKLLLKPLAFGKPGEVPAERVKAIQDELQKRMAEDQAVRKDSSRHREMGKVDAGNTAWLRKVVGELGWIDAGRFGAPASNAAFLLVQHSADLSLMTAALPEIEKDLKAKRLRDAQPFALLYDRTRLMLGEKQRYGTQLGRNLKGEAVVLPLEDRARVEELRKEIGIFPLKTYLQTFKRMNGGRAVKFMDDEEDEAPSAPAEKKKP
jgi:hypothetical protein